MFAFTGVSDQANTDVMAHILGFLSGLLAGFAISKSRIERLSLSDHQRAGGFTLILILVSWLAAMP